MRLLNVCRLCGEFNPCVMFRPRLTVFRDASYRSGVFKRIGEDREWFPRIVFMCVALFLIGFK